MAETGETSVFIGVDVGTSGLKAVAMDEGGRIVAQAGADYPLMTPRPGWSEQDPEAWWSAACRSLRDLADKIEGREIRALGLTGQMHGSVFLDRHAAVIRPALLWNDARTGDECAEIEHRMGRKRVIEITGNRASAGFQAPKLLWLRANEPDNHAALRHLLLPKDFVRYRLTGELATDAADASGTLLLDLKARQWSDEMLDALGVPADWLPEVFESAEVTGRVSEEAAAETGLPWNLPVVAGGGDNACAAIGAGIIEEGAGVCSIGSSGTIFVHNDRALYDPEGALNAFCACVPGGWHLMGVILSAGAALAWHREQVIGGEVGFEALLDEAAEVPAGSDGLVFLPYLAGERSPHMDPEARGGWLGLSLAHSRAHMTRAVIEGVGYAFADCLARMRHLGARPPALHLVGGGARHRGWRRILAAQLDLELKVLAAAEGAAHGAAHGAAMLAAVGRGDFANLGDVVRAAATRPTLSEAPDHPLARTYRDGHARYARLYPALSSAGFFSAKSSA